MAVITISRQFGSGGDAIAQYVASVLGYDLIDKEQIIEAAKLARQNVEMVAPTNAFHFLTVWYMQQEPSFLPSELCYYELPDKLFEHHSAQTDSEFSARNHRRFFFEKTIERLWKHGNVVIVGRGANYILRDEPNVLRVRVITPFTMRAYRVAREEHLNYEEALDAVVGNDNLRARYIHESYQRHWDDESLYDLVLNTEKIGRSAAVDLIVGAVKGLETHLETQILYAERPWI